MSEAKEKIALQLLYICLTQDGGVAHDALVTALATAEQQGKEAGRAWVPGQPLWDWEPWARFLGARAQLIHAAVAEGQPVAEIREWLSMDEGQVRLIAASNLDGVAGIPGKVWPPPSNPEGGT